MSSPCYKQHLPVVVTEVLLEVSWWSLLAWVVLVVAAVVRVVELLSLALGLALGLLAVDIVGTLGLGKTVDLAAGETSKELLGELVRDWLA